jgi:hypothetical protein
MAVRRSSRGDMSAFSLQSNKAVAVMGSNDLNWEVGNLNYGHRIVNRKFGTPNLCGKTLIECSKNYGLFRK